LEAFHKYPLGVKDSYQIKVACTMNRFSQMQKVIEKMQPTINIRLGGAGNKALFLLDENADILLHMTRGIKFWDMCAAEALMRARFGIVTDKNRAPIDYDHTLNDYTLPNGIIMSRTQDMYDLCHERLGTYLQQIEVVKGIV